MVPITALWLPILISTVIVFIASSIIHMMLGIHKSDCRRLHEEDKVMDALRAAGVTPGPPRFRLAALLALVAVVVAGCRKDPLAGLAELPPDLASKLQVVPGQGLLATKIRVKAPPPTQPPPPCAADSTSTYYETHVTAPVTLCTNLSEAVLYDRTVLPPGAAITHYKLSSASEVPNLQDIGLLQFPLFCSTSFGPFSADLESDRLCVGTCSPENSLTITGIPNTVVFFWGGEFNVPPVGADFKFVGPITKIDFVDWGRCHSDTGAGAQQ